MKTKNAFLKSLFAFSILLTACANISFFTNSINGSGNIITESRDVSDFDRISLEGYGEVTIEQGETKSLTVTTDDNIMPFVKTEVRQNTLILDFTDKNKINAFDTTDGIKFHLVVKDLNRVDVTGAGAIFIDDLVVDKLQFELSGAGSLDIDNLMADELVVHQSGAGSVNVSGKVSGQEVVLTGVGSYQASDLESDTAIIEITGVGGATVWVHETLDVEITSIGSVNYYGTPSIIQDVNGLGSLVSEGDK